MRQVHDAHRKHHWLNEVLLLGVGALVIIVVIFVLAAR